MGRRTLPNPSLVPSAEVIEKERQTLELRRAGVSFDDIANRVGYNDRGAAHKAYKRALARTLQEPAAEIRELEQDRLDRLQVAVWAKALRGDLGAVDRVLRIFERRARLLGLDHSDGIAERQTTLAEQQGQLLVMVIRGVLGDLQLSPAQMELAEVVVPQHLRAVAELESGGAA